MALLEGSSLLLLLFIAVPMKRLLEMPEMVTVIGPLHGLFFIVFNVFLIVAMLKKHINIKEYLWGFVAALVPFGTFVYKAKILNAKKA